MGIEVPASDRHLLARVHEHAFTVLRRSQGTLHPSMSTAPLRPRPGQLAVRLLLLAGAVTLLFNTPLARVNTFLAVGALILLACVVAVWLVRLLAIASPRARQLFASIRLSVEGQGLWLAWLMAAVAMAGSLYYSQVAGFPPCEYCWYQRIAMYPLVLILGIAIFRGDGGVRRYVLPLATAGGLISAYHYGIERFPDLQVGACSATIPCSQVWFQEFGFVTIAFMAFVCFSVIVTVLLLDRGPAAVSAEGAYPDRPREPEDATQ